MATGGGEASSAVAEEEPNDENGVARIENDGTDSIDTEELVRAVGTVKNNPTSKDDFPPEVVTTGVTSVASLPSSKRKPKRLVEESSGSSHKLAKLTYKRASGRFKSDSDDDGFSMKEYMKYSMMERQAQRDTEAERDRRLERERERDRQMERQAQMMMQQQQQMMQMMMIGFMGSRPTPPLPLQSPSQSPATAAAALGACNAIRGIRRSRRRRSASESWP